MLDASFVDIVKAAIDMTHRSKEPIEIKIDTLEKVKSTLKKDADPCSLVVGYKTDNFFTRVLKQTSLPGVYHCFY